MEGFLILAFLAVLLGGLVKGLTGFGYAVVSTPLIASFFPARQAIAFMILPLVAINLELVSEMKKEDIKSCVNNFEVYIIALILGTAFGFYMTSFIPDNLLKVFLALITALFAISRTDLLDLSIQYMKRTCFRRSPKLQLPLGLFSGLIFGGSNVGVQIVAYLKTMDLERGKFVGLVALVMVPVSAMRLPLIFASNVQAGIILWSILAAPFGLAAAYTGNRLADKFTESLISKLTIFLLLIISMNLVRTAAL